MYIPKQFEETNIDVLHRLIQAKPLATLVTLMVILALASTPNDER